MQSIFFIHHQDETGRNRILDRNYHHSPPSVRLSETSMHHHPVPNQSFEGCFGLTRTSQLVTMSVVYLLLSARPEESSEHHRLHTPPPLLYSRQNTEGVCSTQYPGGTSDRKKRAPMPTSQAFLRSDWNDWMSLAFVQGSKIWNDHWGRNQERKSSKQGYPSPCQERDASCYKWMNRCFYLLFRRITRCHPP
jgi:hypothetical protein